MVLTRLALDARNSPVLSFDPRYTSEEFDFNPSYQRGSVWTDSQRVALVKSLLQGLPIGAIFLNRRSLLDPTGVVDGKQRIETIRAFIADNLAVPTEWFDDHDLAKDALRDRLWNNVDAVYYSDLKPRTQRIFGHASVAVYITTFKTEAEERDLYLRINTGGTAHTDADLARARQEP